MITIIEAKGKYLEKWDVVIDKSINGTIFNYRKFLSYHGNKFSDSEKYLLFMNNNNVVAQMNLSIERIDHKIICRSPYGASYGGIIFQHQPSYNEGKEIVTAFVAYLNENSIDQLYITPPINCCCESSLDSFYFNMLEAGFKIINQDISSVVVFDNNISITSKVSSSARYYANQARRNGIVLDDNSNDISNFYNILKQNYNKFGKLPTHTEEELKLLINSLPDKISLDIAYMDNIPVAGIAYFVINKRVKSSFYLCQLEEYKRFEALRLLVLTGLEKAQRDGYKYFDFGTSSLGMVAKPNIFHFKNQYSKIGYFRYTYRWENVSP